MHARFLLGPAGSGKTFLCLAEIRAELLRSPDGPPLLLLAPKQATFQLERQLLADFNLHGKTHPLPLQGGELRQSDGSQFPSWEGSGVGSPVSPAVSPDRQLHGYTRLQILSFERLAQFVLEQCSPASLNWLDDEGRVMVLRALLAEKRSELRLFHATARLPGFATRLSLLLRELQRHQISPERLLTLADKITGPAQLRDKLHDFALLLRGYLDWLKKHELRDANGVLDEATAVLRSPSSILHPPSSIHLAGLWLDGFAEMTSQELDLLSAIVPLCDHATLAFCLEAEPHTEPSWLSTWSVIGQTFIRCRQRLGEMLGAKVPVEMLKRDAQHSRFDQSPALRHLEEFWTRPISLTPGFSPVTNTPADSPAVSKASHLAEKAAEAAGDSRSADDTGLKPGANENSSSHPILLACCANPEAEAILAAREVRRFIRDGGRYREAAVIVRSLDGYADTLQRIFQRYEIPCFLDHREPVAHHPLAELTRFALRTAAFNWRQADWFGALKTGLVPAREEDIDWLENVALEYGWDGNVWLQPIALQSDDQHLLHVQQKVGEVESLRRKLVPPFATLQEKTAAAINGVQLAAAIRELWKSLDVESTLERWTLAVAEQSAIGNRQSAIHSTVWDQMQAWLENLERAFPSESLPLRDWLPIVEAGLASLTVGVIPPALDQVVIGAIDRSRNPDLKLALALGLNEGIFPAPPAEDPLLNELERKALVEQGAKLGPGTRHRIGHEWFYGYIACTRASQRLVLVCSQSNAKGDKINRSPFFDHLEKLFPNLKLENWQPPAGFSDVEHVSEIIAPAIRLQVGRVTPCAPLSEPASQSGAHGVTRPTDELLALPELADVLAKARQVADAIGNDQLSAAVAEKLYGRELATSVSGLEDYAACPFKFFISRGLRAEERKCFELDARERGSFQHEVLTIFHIELAAEHRKWRDVSPNEARERVRRIGRNLLATYRNGLFVKDDARRFAGDMLLASLETLITVLIGWARDYRFDPELVEAGFGLRDTSWPAWKLELAGGRALLLRGRIDRVDVWRDENTGAALAVVVDYKSSSRKPDRRKLYHGLQLQLPSYLNVVEQLPEVRAALGASPITPAGVFYVNLRGEFASAKSRSDALGDTDLALREGFQHFGRYDDAFLDKLDPFSKGEQFKSGPRSADRMASPAFRDLLNRAVENLKRFGDEIFTGRIAPDPYRKGNETACDQCDYAAICRFDPWTQPFRTLPMPEKTAKK